MALYCSLPIKEISAFLTNAKDTSSESKEDKNAFAAGRILAGAVLGFFGGAFCYACAAFEQSRIVESLGEHTGAPVVFGLGGALIGGRSVRRVSGSSKK